VLDDDIRASCFASLDVLCAKHGPELPYAGGLDAGFAFRGRRVPFLNYQKGIYRAAVQRGPAALSVNTSFKSPYDDAETPDGFLYGPGTSTNPTTARSARRPRRGRRSSTSLARGRARTGPSGRSSSRGTILSRE